MARLTQRYLYWVFLVFSITSLASTTDPAVDVAYDEKEILDRLKELDHKLMEPKYTKVVKSYIRAYVVRRRDRSEKILGRTIQYFPLFEEYLKKYNLPLALKYLPVVESALNPEAVSRVGAVGLWQFMPETAKGVGLKINRYVDERKDPHKSTDAAMRYLTKLYNRHQSWPLALAAYNSGSGRVRRAIRRGRSKNYWRIRRYLPRETRNYVPAFIAASYLAEFYGAHNLSPVAPELDFQLTETIKVYDYHTFYRIAQITGLSLEIIEDLNPAYRKNFIPSNPNGNYLTLPRRVMQAFKDYLNTKIPDRGTQPSIVSAPVIVKRPAYSKNKEYIKSTYIIKEGETIEDIAKRIKCTPYQLKVWNKLSSYEVTLGQELIVFYPKEIKRYMQREKLTLPAHIASRSFPEVGALKHPSPLEKKKLTDQITYIYYVLSKKEKPSDVARKLLGVSYEDLKSLNRLKNNRPLKPGSILKVPNL